MNLIFKMMTLTLLVFSTNARDFYLITYEKENKTLELIKKEIAKTLPTELIEYRQRSRPCEDVSEHAILHLCVKDDDFDVVSFNEDILSRAMRVFNDFEN